MLLQQLLMIVFVQNVRSYYLYNERTHHVISYPSLVNLPDGFKILRPPKSARRSKHVIDDTRLICQPGGFLCSEPYTKSITYQFECEFDHQCPSSYKCCPENCFTHKICSKGKIHGITNNYKPSNNRHPLGPDGTRRRVPEEVADSGQCEKWPNPCQTPYPYHFSYRYKCESDAQCPKDYICCQQNCFVHKICSKNITQSQYDEALRNRDQKSFPDVTSKPENLRMFVSLTNTEDMDGESEDNSRKVESPDLTLNSASTTETTENVENDTELNNDNSDDELFKTTLGEESTIENEETVSQSETVTTSSTLDPNAIIPENSDYYYDEDGSDNEQEENNEE